MTLNYAWTSAVATFRNFRFVIFTTALPVILFLLFNSLYGGSNGDTTGGISTGAYLMISMACYGALGASLNAGARIAVERQTGWNRQLRLSALSSRGYLTAKAAVSMLVALPALILVFLLGAFVAHVQLSAVTWVLTGLVIWICIIPFAVLGLVIGSMGTPDTIQPISVLAYMGLAILGGLWFPLEQFPPFLTSIAKVLPSYWLAENGRDMVAGTGVSMLGVLVLLGWTVVLGAIGAVTYRRSGRRS